MVNKILAVAGTVLGVFVAFGFQPFDGVSLVQEAGIAIACLGAAMLL